ncbi:hypothetical protein BS47DRAFT_1352409 [Hydnum rufescens UP504]|uniref:F-box domain-containing protein n=1 Tax=Hydnum rufescens UP504 TaxID=1448309 RepID=A0A9P6AJE0_9AGAM|nr:hypothetical protein BS47DRAFT_1352409 [Hydnum rufescens UP504]
MRAVLDGRQGTQRLLNSIRDSLVALGPVIEEDSNRITLGPITDIATSNRLRRDPAILHEFSQFDADLKTMEEIDGILHTLQRRLLAQRNEYQTQLAPISIIPVEILRSIFVYVMTSEIGSPGFVRDTPKYVASITHVCRRWRTIALEQAQLWTHINANWPPDQITTWLSRGTLPLRVTYVHNPKANPPTYPGLSSRQTVTTEDEMRAVNTLVSHSHRWRAAKLTFNIGFFGVMHRVLSESDFGQLRTLLLHGHPGTFTEQHSANIDAGAFPRLHSLELFRAHIRNLTTLCPQLVHLVVSPTRLELEEWAAVLPSCHFLEYLEIGWLGSDRLRPSAIALPPIPMAKLKTFTVRNVSLRTFTDLVGRVRSPCLTTFSMGSIARLGGDNLWGRSLQEFVSHLSVILRLWCSRLNAGFSWLLTRR